MSVRRMITLIAVGVTLSIIASACAGSSAPEVETIGCRQDIRGVTGVIRPETSGLGCSAINELIFGIPSEPQGYSILGESPRLLWQCRLYATRGHSVLLQCSHQARHFSVVKGSG